MPHLLPSHPLDRYDGQALKYALHNGRPMLYSVGIDRDDDGGRPAVDPKTKKPDPMYAASTVVPRSKLDEETRRNFDGDWILWPVPREPTAD